MPVISVGNLTWGGNGKTPMVEFIALWLADSGISPLILSRVVFIFHRCFLISVIYLVCTFLPLV